MLGFELAEESQAVHAGPPVIGNHQIKVPALGHSQCLFARPGFKCLNGTLPFEYRLHHFPEHSLVINQQDHLALAALRRPGAIRDEPLLRLAAAELDRVHARQSAHTAPVVQAPRPLCLRPAGVVKSMRAHEIVEILIESDGPVIEASVHLPRRGRKWIAADRDETGRQVWRSTGLRDRQVALTLAKGWEAEARRKKAAQPALPPKPTIRVRVGSAEREMGHLEALLAGHPELMSEFGPQREACRKAVAVAEAEVAKFLAPVRKQRKGGQR